MQKLQVPTGKQKTLTQTTKLRGAGQYQQGWQCGQRCCSSSSRFFTQARKLGFLAAFSAWNFAGLECTYGAGLRSTNCLHEVRVAVKYDNGAMMMYRCFFIIYIIIYSLLKIVVSFIIIFFYYILFFSL